MTLRRTPLYDRHLAAGARMVPFAGYEMPIHYKAGITAEHNAVRTSAGLFDVSHMGEFMVTGPDALKLVQHVSTNDASVLKPGQAQYSTLPREDGHLLDDLLVYRFEDHFMLVVNASNREKDLDWILKCAADFDVEVEDRSDQIALIALQGPDSEKVLARLTDTDLGRIKYYRFEKGAVAGHSMIISRTGYTGEDGFELYLDNQHAGAVWDAILEAGEEELVIPAGLGARDSLRLEMGYALYGNDLDETRNPFEAGLGWVTKLDKGEFAAGDALRRIKECGVDTRLAGFQLTERGFPRPGYEIQHDGQVVGSVTSGTMSPSMGVGIGMAYLPKDLSKAGTPLEVVIRGQPVPAVVVRPPFYSGGSIRH